MRRVLEHLLPSLSHFANHSALSVDVRWQPLTFASGDYYDVLELSPSRFLFALGDITGHGAATAPIFGMIRSQLHASAHAGSQPHELLSHLHEHMLRHGHPNVFMTLSLLLLDVDTLTAEFSIAGPPCPLIYRRGECRSLTSEFGWTLGFPFRDVRFYPERISVERGDVLFFYTDGLSDSVRGPDANETGLGVDQLAAMLSEECATGSETIADGVFNRVEAYRCGWPLEDDATALAVRVR